MALRGLFVICYVWHFSSIFDFIVCLMITFNSCNVAHSIWLNRNIPCKADYNIGCSIVDWPGLCQWLASDERREAGDILPPVPSLWSPHSRHSSHSPGIPHISHTHTLCSALASHWSGDIIQASDWLVEGSLKALQLTISATPAEIERAGCSHH